MTPPFEVGAQVRTTCEVQDLVTPALHPKGFTFYIESFAPASSAPDNMDTCWGDQRELGDLNTVVVPADSVERVNF